MKYDTHCFYSTVRNISGVRMVFGFLPPHGRELQINEQYTVFGNIIEAVAIRDGGDRNTSQRHVTALLGAVNRGELAIIQTPSIIILDDSGKSVMLVMRNGVLGTDDPCWYSSGSVVSPKGGRQFIG